jgi:phosphatidate phosphatase PAH1
MRGILAVVGSCSLVGGCLTDGTLQITETSLSASTRPTEPLVEPGEPAPTDSTPTSTSTDACPRVTDATRAVVVTDIDETLTTSDNEWLTQIGLPNAIPEMRPDADAVMRTYFERGYRVMYLTARGEGSRLRDGTTAREATETWLADHDFPYTTDGVFLADGLAAFGGEAAVFKTEVLEDLQAAGFELVFAYGNADTDVEAYQNVGIPDDRIFLVGDLAGQFGVEPIPTSEAYTAHLPRVEQFVPCAPAP